MSNLQIILSSGVGSAIGGFIFLIIVFVFFFFLLKLFARTTNVRIQTRAGSIIEPLKTRKDLEKEESEKKAIEVLESLQNICSEYNSMIAAKSTYGNIIIGSFTADKYELAMRIFSNGKANFIIDYISTLKKRKEQKLIEEVEYQNSFKKMVALVLTT